MGETEGEVGAADTRASEEPESTPVQDTLAVPVQKRRKVKSPTPGTLRGRSATPIRGRSQTPFNLYLTRRSATPSTWRSITPFLKREEREKTPFELGRDIKTQITCNKAVFDRALIMDITESEEIQKPVRYITTDMSVIDRAAVMDVSNVEVIYLIEEYEEVEEEEEIIEEVKPKKKGKGKKARTPRKSIEKDVAGSSAASDAEPELGESVGTDREESIEPDDLDEPVKKTKKKAVPKKKEKKEKSPSPKLTLKLEMGGGQKASKKMFEDQQKQQDQAMPPAPKPPQKKSKLVLQMEEQARAAAKAAEEEAAKAAAKPKGETFAERQERLKKEKQEQERIEAELRAALRAQKEAEQAEEEETEEPDEEGDEEEDDAGDESYGGTESYGGDYGDEGGSEFRDDEEEAEEVDVVPELPKSKKRRGSNSSEEFTRPNPYDEERWKRIAEEEGEEFMQQMRKYSMRIHKSEKERDAEWQRIREQARLPHFIVFLTDRTVEAGHSVRISCAVGGPELSVKWFKDGRQLERDATHRIINNNNILVLEVVNTTILDSGEYSCVVANANDSVTSSCYVTIYEVFKDEPAPPSCKLIKEYYHLRDDELTIECHLHGVPRPAVVWMKGGLEIKPSFKFTMLEEAHGVYKLLIYKPNDKDGGTYVCKAANSSGEVQISHHVEVAKNRHFHARGIFHARDRLQKDKELTAKKAMEEALQSKAASDRKRTSLAAEARERVHRASPEPLVSPKQKLKFATQLRDRMALEGSTVRFVCTVIGPSPNCRWMKDDKWIVAGPNIKNLSEEGKAILEVSKVTSEASGVYKCVAKNEHSEIDTQCYFKVYSAQADGDEQEPIFALPLRDVYHSSQNDLIIDTKVRGNPRPKITWVKDNLPVVLDDRRVQIEHLDGVCELIINKPTSSDSGVYTCIAENKLGSQKTTHTVVVDVVQTSRRSSLLSGVMTESDSEAGAGEAGGKKAEKSNRLPKGKKKDDDAEAGTYERRSRMPDPSPKTQLYFIANLSNRYVAEGSKVKLQAVVGGPDATFKWQKDEQNLVFGPRLRNMSREGMACLEFLNTALEDSGVYTLAAQNEFCKITTSASLHVYSPKVSTDVQPMFTRSVKETYHLNTNELILETGVRGQPAPQIQWSKDNFEINSGGRIQILQHQDGTCELIIDRPDTKDSGKYVVRAENSAGKSEISHTVLFEGQASRIAENIHGVFHADKSLLRPKAAEEEKPGPTKGGEAAEGEGDEKEGKGKKGKGKKAKKEEEEVTSSATDYASDAGSLKKREKVIGIHFATSVRDRVVAEGSKVKISCFLESKEPQVKWFKNEEPIANSPKIRGRYSEGLCLLEIASATEEDSGVYKCWARDETGEASTFCKLEVYADPGTGDVPPTFTRNIKDTYHGKINELQLDVHVRGLPTPSVTWVKDGVKIESSEKYQQIDHDDGLCELFVIDPVPADSGKYVCQAENREGKTEISHIVTVEPRRKRPVSPSKEARPPVKPPTEEEEKEGEGQEGEGKEEKKKKKKAKDDEEGGGRREVPPPPDLKKYLYLRNFLSNRTVKAGSNVKWMVNIDGPEPTARWFHGEQPIAFGPKSKMSCQDGIAWLNLIGVTEEEAGEYTLRVKGSENEVVSTCELFVYKTGVEEVVAPVFTVGIKDSYHKERNEISLECKVSGNPKPQIYWQKDNTLLPLESGKYKYLDSGDGITQLIITEPIKADTGLYTCYAENESGQMKISKFLDISDYVQKLTQKRTLQKVIQETEPTASAGSNERESSAQFKSKIKDEKLKLTAETTMKPLFISEGNKAQLIFYVSGHIEEVYWLRGDERVTKDMRHKMYNINGAISLEIHNARVDDTGIYKCVVRNNRNTIENCCHLTVYDQRADKLPSSFASLIKESYDAHRNEITFTCQVHGRPNVTWLRDDHSISNNRYKSVEEVGGIRKLIIRNPIPSDCGTFSCFAETNEHIHAVSKSIRTSDLKQLMVSSGEVKTNGEDITHTRRSSQMPHETLTSNGETPQHYTTDEAIKRSRERRPLSMIALSKPLFSTLLHDRTVAEGTSIRLSCNVVCDGDTRIEWLKNHRPLPNDGHYLTMFRDGIASLDIDATNVDDSGNYTCRAINDYGETFTHAQLRIYKHFEDAVQPSAFVQSIRDTYSINENTLVLDCRVRGKPRPDIQWMKGSDLLNEGDRYNIINSADGYTKLIINNPTEKDSGLYACVARNEAAENKITHQVDFVGRERFALEKTHGYFHRDPNKPHFMVPLSNQTVCPGGTVAISAEFMQSSTPLEVQWLRNRQSVAGQPGIKTFMEGGVYTLTILNAQPELEGTYTCRASNAFGRIESHVSVDVAAGAAKNERPPLFLSRPEPEMKILVGDPFSISFRIAGEPKPKLIFMKGIKDITKSDRVSKEVSDDYTRFTVQSSQISDSGTYFVVARNNFGTDRVFVTIAVMPRARSETPTSPRWGQRLESFPDVSYFRDPPGALSTEPLVVDSGPTHISLSWGKPIRDNSAPVIAYRVDSWVVGHEGGAMWKELGLTPINSFDAFNLKPNVEYHFRVTPKNRYGWGPSTQTSCPVQVGGAECLPEFVKILPGQMKALLGKQLMLECTVRGAPRPQIDWYKDGMHINPLAERVRIRQIGSTCTLIIAPISELDAGRYTCEATNSKGRVSTFARLQIVSDSRLYEADTKLKEIVHSADVAHAGDTLPIFTMRLRDRRVQMTYPVRLTCQVLGYPTPEVIWYKDDQEITENRRCLITDDGQFHTLELASTILDDSGVYTCTAKNELGSVSCHCSLVVDKGIRAYISPEFYMPLDPLYIYQERQEIRLTAKVEAYPTVGVSWHRNGVRLRPSRRIGASLDSNGFVELIISEATPYDAGIYVCVASNAVGKAESSCRVVIEEPDEDQHQQGQRGASQIPTIVRSDLPYSKEPMFVVKPRSSEAYEGDTVIICCEVVGDPKPEVVWLRDFLNPEYYKDAPHFRPIGDGPEYRLEIPSAKLDFTGTYSVIASNCHGEAKAVISLQIFAKDILNNLSMEKGSIRHGNVETFPRFIRHLRDLRCCDGDAITLECHVEALPEPIIIWEKDGRVLPSGKDFTMSYDGIKATLSIPRIYPEDEGEYTCVAKNNLGRSLSSACIIVDVPEEKENMINRQLSRPTGLLSANSTPRSTPRSTPNRCFSPRRLSYRSSQIDLTDGRIGSYRSAMLDSHTLAAPKFLAIPHSRVVEEGDNVRFQCAITGHPTPWSTWDKEGLIVTPTARIAVKEVDDLRFLEINEVTFDDAGLYRITLENDYGRIEATARLDVIGRSRYSRSPSVRGIRASSSRRNAHLHRRIMGPSTAIGGRMALATGYRGSSVPTCKFYHNGIELDEDNERVQITVNEHEALLCIDNVTERDEGLYTCIIQGDHEPLLTSTWVKFEATEKDALAVRLRAPLVLRPLPALVQTYERETIDLSFELDGDEPYTYTWTRNGEVLTDDEDFNHIDHGNGVICLRINDAFDLDSGEYACEVRTAAGLTCSTACQLSIIEIDDECLFPQVEHDCQPILLKSPLPVLTNAGAAEVAFCARVYPPEASVQWFIGGHEIVAGSENEAYESDSSEKAVIKPVETQVSNEADGVRILRIQNVQQRHCGEVQLSVTHCGRAQSSILRAYTSLIVLPGRATSTEEIAANTSNADNTIEALSSSAQVELPAYILEGPQDCTALIGGSVKLSVYYEAVPRAEVSWFKGCRPIVEQRNISIRSSAKRSTLLITDIAADDSGKYTVEIMNALGSDSAAASVAVEGPPDAPSGKPSISQGPDRIAVAWCGPPYDGGCMITGFIIEMQQLTTELNHESDNLTDGESAWHEIATVVDSLAYTVKNLTPSATYRFRVRAKNVHGCSAPSLPSDPVELQAQEISTEDFQRPICVKAGGDFKSRFEILEELGKGRFGVVYRVQEREEPKQILAAKVIKCIKAQDRQKVMEEISIMKSLQHPKLLQLAASFESSREIVMVMEYITGGELFERVVADDFTLTERDCILFLRQVCEGVAYMHTQSIVHLDLKPENIMCHTRTSHQIKIIDFGLAQRLNTNTPVRVLFGTPEFIPPEIISYEPIGFQSDMWSVGVICYVLLSGLSPFMGDTDVDTFSNITRADYDFDDEAFDCVSQEAKDFILNLLVHRKENRLTAKQCLESKWLTQAHDENLSNKICTDKLKKFIIRRKWQKTGNAIRALGRMATLSASRRNSAVSGAGSLPNSPRPSISGIHHMFHPHTNAQMGSLHEEDDDFSIELPSQTTLETQRRIQKTLKMRDKSQCSERSDSGYSECSNCSIGGNLPCHCGGSSTVQVIVQHTVGDDLPTTNAETLLSLGVAHDVLKTKLEEIAQQGNTSNARNSQPRDLRNMEELESNAQPTSDFIEKSYEPISTREQRMRQANLSSTVPASTMEENDKHIEHLQIQMPDDISEPVHQTWPLSVVSTSPTHINTLESNVLLASPPSREPIMRSDFTNTIKMRKKSLENNVLREKPKQQAKPIFEAAGKVSQLKNKFNMATSAGSIGKSVSAKLGFTHTSPLPVRAHEHAKELAAAKRFASADQSSLEIATSATTKSTNSTIQQQQQKHCTSMPSSPLLGRAVAPLRLSSRVREATERLAQQQTVATSARRIEARR